MVSPSREIIRQMYRMDRARLREIQAASGRSIAEEIIRRERAGDRETPAHGGNASGSNPVIAFDSSSEMTFDENDYLEYNKSSNQFVDPSEERRKQIRHGDDWVREFERAELAERKMRSPGSDTRSVVQEAVVQQTVMPPALVRSMSPVEWNLDLEVWMRRLSVSERTEFMKRRMELDRGLREEFERRNRK